MRLKIRVLLQVLLPIGIRISLGSPTVSAMGGSIVGVGDPSAGRPGDKLFGVGDFNIGLFCPDASSSVC